MLSIQEHSVRLVALPARSLAAVLAIGFFFVVSSFAQAQERAANRTFRSGPGFVLLHNSEVLQGDVQAFEFEVEVKLDQTGSVRFPNDKVAFVGASLEELYLYQSNRVQQWGLGDHLRIGRWCTQHGLFENAMPHYEYLKSQIPDRIEFKQFQTELREAMLKDTEMQTALQAAGYNVPVTTNDASSKIDSANASSTGISNLQKSQHVARVEPKDQEIFRTDIHPIMVTSCARAACHGAFSSNSFVLADATRMSTRDAVGRNLATFTNYLNSKRGTPESLPEEHPLYQKAVNRHGQLIDSPLNVNDPKHQRFMEQLRLWVARANSQQQQSSNEIAAGTLVSESSKPQAASQQTTLTTASFELPPSLGPKAADYFKNKEAEATARQNAASMLQGKELDGISAAIAKLEAIERQRQTNQDPFDPNEFNKLYGPNSSDNTVPEAQSATLPNSNLVK